MAFGGLDKKSNGAPMAEINMTPLVDVMLVLLVIFIVTAPLFTHAVRVDLPKAAAQPMREKPDTVTISIDKDDQLHWDKETITADALRARLEQVSSRQPQPELHIHADQNTRYQKLAEIMAAAQNAGLQKIGFVTNPGKK